MYKVFFKVFLIWPFNLAIWKNLIDYKNKLKLFDLIEKL